MEHLAYQPDITQRSIVAAALKILEGVTHIKGHTVRIPVERDRALSVVETSLEDDLLWNKTLYIVTFRLGDNEWVFDSIE